MKVGSWLVPIDPEMTWKEQVVRFEQEGPAQGRKSWWVATNTRLRDGSWALRNDGLTVKRAESYMRIHEEEDGTFSVNGLETRLRLEEAEKHLAVGESMNLFQ